MKKHYTLLAGILTVISPAASFGQWQATAGPLGAGHISSIAVKGPNILAGTLTGGVFISSDSGASWTASIGITNSTEVKALATDGTNAFAGFAASLVDTFAVFVSTDNGASWTHTSLSYNYLFSLAAKPGYLIAGTWYGVSYSTNSGTSWGGSTTGLPGNASVSALALSGTKIFCGVLSSGSGGTGVFSSINNGVSWNPFNTGWATPAISALAVLGSDIFAGAGGGTVYKSATTVSGWTSASTGLTSGSKALFVLGNNLYAGGAGGIAVTFNGGTNWMDISAGFPIPGTIYSIASDNVYLYAGADSMVWRRPLAEIITGIEANEIPETNVSIYPNPFNSNATLQINLLSGISSLPFDFLIYDLQGRQVRQFTVDKLQFTIDRENLVGGIYFYKLNSGNENLAKGKVVVQ